MSKKNTPLDFKNPAYKQTLKINPMKVLAHQKAGSSVPQQPRQPKKSQVPRHKNIAKPQPAKQAKQTPYKTKMCPLGRDCKKQFSCRFAHHQKQLRRPFYKRTKPCLLYQRGLCGLGSACRQYHGNFDLKNWNEKTYKKALCEQFEKGFCPKGELCVRAHGKQQLEQYLNEEQQQQIQAEKTEQESKPLIIKVDTYKPHAYTMELVEEKLEGSVEIGQTFDLFTNN